MKAMSPRAMAAFVAAEVSAAASPPPPPASKGIATSSGTTARSCYVTSYRYAQRARRQTAQANTREGKRKEDHEKFK